MPGAQKTARYHRLRNEIIDYVNAHPYCSAAQIVAALSIDRRLKNYGLTARKIGFFIPRHCKELTVSRDARSGTRLYVTTNQLG